MKLAYVLFWVPGIEEYKDCLVQFGIVSFIHAKVPVVLPVIAFAYVNTSEISSVPMSTQWKKQYLSVIMKIVLTLWTPWEGSKGPSGICRWHFENYSFGYESFIGCMYHGHFLLVFGLPFHSLIGIFWWYILPFENYKYVFYCNFQN